MSYAENGGVKVWYDIAGNPDGPAVVLHHGFTSDHTAWRRFGYVAALKEKYRLIMLDARGHGRSDKPHDRAAYAIDRLVGDVQAVMDAAGAERAAYWGYSMGGWIGYGVAKAAPHRLNCMVIGAAHAMVDESWANFRDVDGGDAERFIGALERVLDATFSSELRAMMLENDLRALAAMARERESMEDVLPEIDAPCLLYGGDRDPRMALAMRCAQRMPQAWTKVLPRLDHLSAFVLSGEALLHVLPFLERATAREAK